MLTKPTRVASDPNGPWVAVGSSLHCPWGSNPSPEQAAAQAAMAKTSGVLGTR